MKNITPKTIFFSLVTSGTYNIRLIANLMAHIDSGGSGLSFGHLTILLASTGIEVIATFYENSPILRKFDFLTPCDLKFDLIKNYLSIFCRNRRGLSNAVYHFSLSFLVFEFSGGGHSPPPPGRAKVAQTPGRARVKGTNPALKKPSNIPELYAKMFGRIH